MWNSLLKTWTSALKVSILQIIVSFVMYWTSLYHEIKPSRPSKRRQRLLFVNTQDSIWGLRLVYNPEYSAWFSIMKVLRIKSRQVLCFIFGLSLCFVVFSLCIPNEILGERNDGGFGGNWCMSTLIWRWILYNFNLKWEF